MSSLTSRANVASAGAITLPEGANYIVVTGTTTITSLSSRPQGEIITLRFSGILTFTYDATALILQGSVNLTTAAGDVVSLVSEGSGNWREMARRLAAAAGGASGGTPAPVLSTSNAAGVATTFLRTDDQLAAFDTTAPVTQAFSDAAAAGTAAVAARRDHTHGMPANPAAPATMIAWGFETAGRYTSYVTGSGVNTFGANGVLMTTGASATGGATVLLDITRAASHLFVGSPTLSAFMVIGAVGTDLNFVVWLGPQQQTGGALTLTSNHAGFKIIRAASGTNDLFATQGNGTTETASASLATGVADDVFELLWKINSTTSCDYYTRKNAGARSSATNLATNMLTTAAGLAQNLSNVGVASESSVYVEARSYSR